MIRSNHYITVEIERGPLFQKAGPWIESPRAWLPVPRDAVTSGTAIAPLSGGVMRPFRIRSDLLEIPCTLPYEPPMVSRAWTGDLLVVNTHPDMNFLGDPKVMKEYERLFDYLEGEGWQSMLPRGLAASPDVQRRP